MKNNKLVGKILIIAMLLVGGAEGLKRYAYQDSSGIWTICSGETKGVKKGDIATKEQCDNQLIKSLQEHNKPLEELPQQLAPNVHLAWLDFCYNVGTGACKSSTAYNLLRNGQDLKSCDQFLRWRFVAGKDCSLKENKKYCGGIWDRRNNSRDLCYGKKSIEQALAFYGKQLPPPDKATLQ